MRLKKVISGVMAVAMAATFAASAFAATAPEGTPGNGSIVLPEDATAGQIAGALADAVESDPSNYANAKRLVDTLNENKNVYVDAKVSNAMMLALRTQGKSHSYYVDNVPVNILSTKELADKLSIEPVIHSASSIVFEANYKNGDQSDLGTYVTIAVPYKLDGTWSWVSDNGQSGAVVVVNGDKSATVSFFAPHFTKYTLTKATTAPATDTSVIKATGADMNTILMGVVGVALAAGAGIAFVSVKKRALSK